MPQAPQFCNIPFPGNDYSVKVQISRSHPTAAVAFRRGTSAVSARKADVFALIEKNFDRFDRDGNGGITWTEMRRNVADPNIRGKDAAALATLYSLAHDQAAERGVTRPPVVTIELLDELKEEREFALEEGEEVAADLYYARYLGKLEKASDQLFPQGLPDPYQVRQGFGPSCAILATTVGQALIDPQVIKDAITEREDGKVAVKFPGLPKPIVVEPTTDSETALFATAGKNGTWLNHVEKAWGATQTRIPGAAFEQSSWPARSIRAWSNAHAATTSVPSELEGHRKGRIPEFLRGVSEALENERIVMTWTRRDDLDIDNLVVGHAHTVLDLDAESGTIKVRNPWGHKEPLDLKGRPRDGKDDGVFELTFQEYVTDFGRISLQTSDPKTSR